MNAYSPPNARLPSGSSRSLIKGAHTVIRNGDNKWIFAHACGIHHRGGNGNCKAGDKDKCEQLLVFRAQFGRLDTPLQKAASIRDDSLVFACNRSLHNFLLAAKLSKAPLNAPKVCCDLWGFKECKPRAGWDVDKWVREKATGRQLEQCHYEIFIRSDEMPHDCCTIYHTRPIKSELDIKIKPNSKKCMKKGAKLNLKKWHYKVSPS